MSQTPLNLLSQHLCEAGKCFLLHFWDGEQRQGKIGDLSKSQRKSVAEQGTQAQTLHFSPVPGLQNYPSNKPFHDTRIDVFLFCLTM